MSNKQYEWDKNNCRKFTIKLTHKNDNDIISVLEACDNKQNFIKTALRHEIIFKNFSAINEHSAQ